MKNYQEKLQKLDDAVETNEALQDENTYKKITNYIGLCFSLTIDKEKPIYEIEIGDTDIEGFNYIYKAVVKNGDVIFKVLNIDTNNSNGIPIYYTDLYLERLIYLLDNNIIKIIKQKRYFTEQYFAINKLTNLTKSPYELTNKENQKVMVL